MSNESSQSPLAPLFSAVARAKKVFASLPKPARILAFTTLLAAIGIGGLFAFRSANEPYATLFTQLEREDAAALVAKLKEMKVPYRVGADGTTIEVPEARVHELRLDLASAGLPRGGGVGFESFDKMRLGATDFEQRVLYRRALEGELARTVGTLGAVQSARVHLVLPEKSVFVAKSEPASASMVIRLRPGRSLGPSEVAGIVHLTASSVPGLTADHVALVTTEGVMLHKPRAGRLAADDGSDESDPSVPASRTIEAGLEDRARAMLEKVVGAGHVDVRVTAEIDQARVERVEDRYDPTHSALRSEESTIDRNAANVDTSVAGIPGAESNTPTVIGDAGAPKVAAPKVADLPTRESHTRNFELDHVTEKRVSSGGAVKRIAVAVIVDGVPKTNAPRSKEELDKLAALVRSAVGATDARGDVVTVESIPFQGDAEAAPAAPVAAAAPTPKWKQIAPVAGVGAALFAVAVMWAVARRRARVRAQKALREAELLAAAKTPVIAQIEPASDHPADLRAAALERARRDPATAAMVLRLWLGATPTEAKPLPTST